MASAPSRFHIVLSPDERRAWTGNAAKLGMPTSEYVRRAVAAIDRPIDEAGIRERADAEARHWDFDPAVLDLRSELPATAGA